MYITREKSQKSDSYTQKIRLIYTKSQSIYTPIPPKTHTHTPKNHQKNQKSTPQKIFKPKSLHQNTLTPTFSPSKSPFYTPKILTFFTSIQKYNINYASHFGFQGVKFQCQNFIPLQDFTGFYQGVILGVRVLSKFLY